MELLIGLDNKQWLPVHVEDLWDPDDDMRLMRSVFGHRYMITDGWGRDILPPDNAPGGHADAQGGAAEQEDAAQEVQLLEYKGWSQGRGNPGNGSGSGVTAPRGRCLGARPKTRGVGPNQVTPPTWGRAAQGGRQRGPGEEPRGPPTSQVRSGARILELARIDPRGSRTTRRQQETASAQVTVTGSGKSTRPTSVYGTRRPPDAEAGTDDGGDDTWHVTGPWLQHRC